MANILVCNVYGQLIYSVSGVHLFRPIGEIGVGSPYSFHPFPVVDRVALPKFAILVGVTALRVSLDVEVPHRRFDVRKVRSVDGLHVLHILLRLGETFGLILVVDTTYVVELLP